MLKGADKLKAAVSFTIPPLKLCTENYNSVRVTGLEPVKNVSEKAFIFKESFIFNGSERWYYVTFVLHKIQKMAFQTSMQHENATRKMAKSGLNGTALFVLFRLLQLNRVRHEHEVNQFPQLLSAALNLIKHSHSCLI